MSSIRRELQWGLAGGIAALLLVAGGSLWLFVRSRLASQFDEALYTELKSFGALLREEGALHELESASEFMPEFSFGPNAKYFEIWAQDGALLERSDSLREADLSVSVPLDPTPSWCDLELPDGRAGRSIGARVATCADEERDDSRSSDGPVGDAFVSIVIARERESLDRTLGSIAYALAGGAAAVLVGVWWWTRGVIARGLSPLASITRELRAIDDPRSSHRFDATSAPIELRPVKDSLNGLLERLDAHFARERRSSANIAHELRTPVAELVLIADVALRTNPDAAECERILREMRDIAARMGSTVATLLEIARLEAGQVALELDEFDIVDLVRACLAVFERRVRERGHTVSSEASAAAVARTDRVILGILLSNLLENAVEHAPPHSDIRVLVEPDDDRVRITITNPSGELSPADVDKLTESFWRASTARESRAHVGLGLSLARRLADVLGIELTLDIADGAFRATLRAPGAAR